MILTLVRTRPQSPRTFGRILDESGARICYSVEPVLREPREPTAIPAGQYVLELRMLPTYGVSIVVCGVPGFGDLRLRSDSIRGVADSSPVLGLGLDPALGIKPGTSDKAVEAVRTLLELAAKRGETSTLNVLDPQ